MTQLKQIESIKEDLVEKGADTQKRKVKTLDYLLNLRNYQSGEKLEKVISIPKYEIDEEYLAEVLEQLGYSNPQYEEDYDGHYEGTCYKITL